MSDLVGNPEDRFSRVAAHMKLKQLQPSSVVVQHGLYYAWSKNLDPVVQSIVSLTISLRHKFVKQISAKVTNTLLFFVEKM